MPAAAASRLVRALGPGAIEQLRSDPYAATEVEGIGFATADALARALGVPADDPARLDAGHRPRAARGGRRRALPPAPRPSSSARAGRFLGV